MECVNCVNSYVRRINKAEFSDTSFVSVTCPLNNGGVCLSGKERHKRFDVPYKNISYINKSHHKYAYFKPYIDNQTYNMFEDKDFLL